MESGWVKVKVRYNNSNNKNQCFFKKKNKNLAGGGSGLIYTHFEKIPMAVGLKMVGCWGASIKAASPVRGLVQNPWEKQWLCQGGWGELEKSRLAMWLGARVNRQADGLHGEVGRKENEGWQVGSWLSGLSGGWSYYSFAESGKIAQRKLRV